MQAKEFNLSKQKDRIEGDTIILNDDGQMLSGIMKQVIINSPNGCRQYAIKKTKNGGYMFN